MVEVGANAWPRVTFTAFLMSSSDAMDAGVAGLSSRVYLESSVASTSLLSVTRAFSANHMVTSFAMLASESSRSSLVAIM